MPLSNFPASLSILYIEDDKNTQEEVAFFLEPLVSTLYLASNGQEGLDLYRLHTPDLIITDIQMPIMNGLDMIKEIRKNDSRTPIFITTAYNETTYLHDAINSGVNRYILKPINFKNLSDIIREFFPDNTNHPYSIYIDRHGTIVNATENWSVLTGYRLDEILNLSFENLIAPQERTEYHRLLENMDSPQEHPKQKIHLLHKNQTQLETVLHAVHIERFGDAIPVFQLEFKTLNTYMYDEELLNKTLEAERFIKGLIQMNSVIYKEIAHIREKSVFLQHLSELFSNNDLFEFAFISYADDSDLVQIAFQGAHQRLDIKSLFPEPIALDAFKCPMTEVIRNQEIVLIEDLVTFNDFNTKSYWVENAIRSIAVLPLYQKSRSQKRGAFCFMLNKAYRLDNEVLELFENITEALNMGLQSIDDQTERHLLEKQLRQERNFINEVLETAGNIILVFNREGSIIQFNKAAEKFTGYTFDEVVNKPFFWKKFLLPEQQSVVETIFAKAFKSDVTTRNENFWISKEGEKRLFDWSNTVLKDENDEVQYLVAIGNDITERKQSEEMIEQLAFYDPLTQLPNRRLFSDYLNKSIVSNKRHEHFSALLFLDLDNFKPLNDAYGHAIGDLLLIEVAHRIKKCIRESDVAARFGGDEFVIVLDDLNDDKALATNYAHRVAEKILSSLAEVYFLAPDEEEISPVLIEHHCTSSIGVVLFGSELTDQNTLIKHADTAMYQAKEAGRNQIVLFSV
ncbi:MAG: diguanylate cyclase [Sulfuricurvum sp.]|uniref:diguanylate cyclase domain-containing protein n=1 Tax=Sulfuricurvum sp. TaxID=2025608 RepID=UPI0026043E54|nr:diguanylate cyclase [Sulfuricurvum sp.]MDD2369743.1 diguanylate cyclase [Sulfuricurvum sp.]MDD5119151.1 diguanylate cyclase [Sulfuricurvum sp.]